MLFLIVFSIAIFVGILFFIIGVVATDSFCGTFGFMIIIVALLLAVVFPYKYQIISPTNLQIFKGNTSIYIDSIELSERTTNYRFLEVPKQKIKIKKAYAIYTNELWKEFVIEGDAGYEN